MAQIQGASSHCEDRATAADAVEPVPVSSKAGIPSAECPLCEGSGEAFMYENFRPCSLCEGEGDVPSGVAAYIVKMGEAQANLVRMAERAREAQRRAEEAFDIISPFVAKFAAATSHYDGGRHRYPGSTFVYDADPSYNIALAATATGLGGPGSPRDVTLGDLRMMAAAYAQAIEARRAEPGTGSVHEGAVAESHAPERED